MIWESDEADACTQGTRRGWARRERAKSGSGRAGASGEGETDLGLVAHETLGDRVDRVEDKQLGDACKDTKTC